MSSLWEQCKTTMKQKHMRPSPKIRNILNPCKKILPAKLSLVIEYIKRISLPMLQRTCVRGSMTVEAALVLPLFCFFVISMGNAIEIIRLHGNLEVALWNAGRQIGVYGALPEGQQGSADHRLEAVAISYTYVKEQIEEQLSRFLGIKKVLWLPRGIYQDETNEHVDNVCAFLRPGEVVLAWTDNKDDPQYELSHQSLSYLENVRDAKGRKLVIHKLPIPDHPICITKEDLDGYTFEEGEDMREVGERLAASYVNFYFSNDAIILPVFGGENKESDERAVQLMQQWNPDRKVIPVFARDILTGGGNIHCITQQIPR